MLVIDPTLSACISESQQDIHLRDNVGDIVERPGVLHDLLQHFLHELDLAIENEAMQIAQVLIEIAHFRRLVVHRYFRFELLCPVFRRPSIGTFAYFLVNRRSAEVAQLREVDDIEGSAKVLLQLARDVLSDFRLKTCDHKGQTKTQGVRGC